MTRASPSIGIVEPSDQVPVDLHVPDLVLQVSLMCRAVARLEAIGRKCQRTS